MLKRLLALISLLAGLSSPLLAATPTYTGIINATAGATGPAITPTTITGQSGQSANILNVTLTPGGTSVFRITAAGAPTFSQIANGCATFASGVLGSTGSSCDTASGTITGVTAGTGLTGGGTSGTVTVALVTPVATANGGTGASSYTTTRCLRTSSATVFASASGDCVTSVTAGNASITIGGTATAPTVAIAAPVSVANGGTGATTLAASPFVVLSPGSQQTGTINVSGAIQSGSGLVLPVAGTIGNSVASLNQLFFGTTNQTMYFELNSTLSSASQLSDDGTSVNGVAGTLINLGVNGVGTFVAADRTGNVGIAGALNAVGVSVGGALSTATTGAFSGTITDSNATPLAFSGTGNNTITSASTGANNAFVLNNTGAVSGNVFLVQSAGVSDLAISGSGSGSTTSANGTFISRGSSTSASTSIVPPLYTQTGVSNIRGHSASGTCTLSTGVNPTCTVTFSGTGNTFTSAASFSCNVSAPSALAPAALPVSVTNTSSSIVTVTAIGTITTGGAPTVLCTGT